MPTKPRVIKIAIKKWTIAGLTGFTSLVISSYYLQELSQWLSTQSLSVLILPLVFIASTLHTIIYWIKIHQSDKLIKETAIVVAGNEVHKIRDIEDHLKETISSEAYTLNLVAGKFIFTNTWAKQKAIDQITKNTMPDVMKSELIRGK